MSVINNIKVYGLEESIKRAKYPMSTDIDSLNDTITSGIQKLGMAKAGTGHPNFLKGIVVQFDLSFTVKAWTEAERYNFLDFVSSQSTMHRITRFDLDSAYIKYTDPRVIDIMKEKVDEYNSLADQISIDEKTLQKMREEKYLEILYTNPCGFTLTAGMTTNYLQLKTIYQQRHNHKLPEWREFCETLKSLPHSEWITGEE